MIAAWIAALAILTAGLAWALWAERPHHHARHRTTRPARLRPLPARDAATVAWLYELNHGPRLSPLTRARTAVAALAIIAARYAPQGDAGPGEWPWLERAWADDTGSFTALMGVS